VIEDDARTWLAANWPAPAHIHAGTTTRNGGISTAPYDSFNLACHVGDRDSDVAENRRRLRRMLALPAEPIWLAQQHGTTIIDLSRGSGPDADGSYTDRAETVCAVMTADCMPLLLCDCKGTEIAAVHIGWRGLCAGIIGNAMRCFRSPAKQLLAWIGPGISAGRYPVGADVRTACLASLPDASRWLTPAPGGKWHADLAGMIRVQLENAGVAGIFMSNTCNHDNGADYFSYRRDGRTGRMASLIWMDTART